MSPLSLSSTIGILGAGQLGKMLAEAAKKLGFKTHVFAPDADPIAAIVADHFTHAEYTNIEALQQFAASVDVITLEFENVPVAPIKTLTTPVFPGAHVLEVSQHRVKEKQLAQSLGIGTAPFMAVNSCADLECAITKIGVPGILKTCTLGYDGKGQWKITDARQLPDIQSGIDYIYEGFVNFEREISVIVARNAAGEMQCFEPVENVHKNHILHTTTAPANMSDAVVGQAKSMAEKLAESLGVVGLLAVEMFVAPPLTSPPLAGGINQLSSLPQAGGIEGGRQVLLNEIAPRPHNSGHWTMDGCNVSQFEQAIRAVTGMPLIRPERRAAQVVMTNLIGDDVLHLEHWQKRGAHIHIYGKREVRAGRKMGHVTEVAS